EIIRQNRRRDNQWVTLGRTNSNHIVQLEGPLEQRGGNAQGSDGEQDEVSKIWPDGHDSSFFQQQGFETVNCIGEGVYARDPSQPPSEGLDRVHGAAGKKQQSVKDAED